MMLISRSKRALVTRGLAGALFLACGVILASCSASTMGDYIPTAAGGLPEGAPQRPAKPGPYPAVHDMPPPRGQAVLTDAEQKKLEDDLVAARNRAAAGRPAGSTGSP
jgi:hypothetical protein